MSWCAARRRPEITASYCALCVELMFDEEYGSGVDVFSFGMVLLEVCERRCVCGCGCVCEYRTDIIDDSVCCGVVCSDGNMLWNVWYSVV